MRKSHTHLAVAAALVATAAAAAPAADAAVPKTGTWRGDLSHVFPPPTRAATPSSTSRRW